MIIFYLWEWWDVQLCLRSRVQLWEWREWREWCEWCEWRGHLTCTTTERTKSPDTLADCRTRKRPSLKPPSRRAYNNKYKNTMMDKTQKILIGTSSAPSRSKLSWKKFSRRPFSGVEGLDRLLGIRLVMLEVLAIWTSPSLLWMLSNSFWGVKPFEVWNNQ